MQHYCFISRGACRTNLVCVPVIWGWVNPCSFIALEHLIFLPYPHGASNDLPYSRHQQVHLCCYIIINIIIAVRGTVLNTWWLNSD